MRMLWICSVAGLLLSAGLFGNFESQGQFLSQAELVEARGGNMKDAKCKQRCDEETGVLVGCSQVGADCTTCAREVAGGNLETAMGDFLREPGEECGEGGFMQGQGSQDCGVIQEGICAEDPDNPGGWLCIGFPTGMVCSEGVMTVEPQLGPPGGPGGPTDPD